MANIKFFRNVASYWDGTNHIPQEGYVWFNTEDRTINLYKNGAWEAYSGIKSASYTNNKLIITPCTGSAITVDLSDMASASTLATLSDNFNNLQTSYNTLSGEFTTAKSDISTLKGEMTNVKTEVAKLSDVTGKVGAYVVEKISAHEAARETIDSGFNTRIGALETAVTNNKTAVEEAFGASYDKTNTIADAIQAAADAAAAAQADIDAWMSATENTDGVIETIKELNTYITEHTDAFTGLSNSVSTNTTDIATNTSDITTIKEQIATINATNEENELIIAEALNDLNTRVDNLASGTVSSVTGTNYITATTTDGAVTVSALTGAVASGIDALAVASDVKAYVDNCWAWGEF